MENNNTQKLKKSRTALIVAVCILSVLLATFVALYAMSQNKQNSLKIDLENIYQRNFSELVDNVNNTNVKLSKVLASNYNSYAKKMLNEISKNTAQASTNLSSLPVSINGIDQTIKFINQVSGFTQSIATKIDKGEEVTTQDIKTLEEIKVSFDELMQNINELSKDIYNGNIYKDSAKLDGDYNNFTVKLQNVKAGDVEYPTMIYDGPFSDSTLNKSIKNLNGTIISKDVAKQSLNVIFKNVPNSNFEYLGETNGKFETYDFEISNNDNSIYVQVTKKGAKLLTMSCADSNNEQNYSMEQAIEIAQNFAKSTGILDTKCVWKDIISNDAYINLSPVQNGVILYPDLVKVKVDLFSGNVVGFEASSYYINHTKRDLSSPSINSEQAQQKVPQGYLIKTSKLCIAPLEYNREVLCYEIMCIKNGETYYIYINANSGEIENILKTVETDNGNLLL